MQNRLKPRLLLPDRYVCRYRRGKHYIGGGFRDSSAGSSPGKASSDNWHFHTVRCAKRFYPNVPARPGAPITEQISFDGTGRLLSRSGTIFNPQLALGLHNRPGRSVLRLQRQSGRFDHRTYREATSV